MTISGCAAIIYLLLCLAICVTAFVRAFLNRRRWEKERKKEKEEGGDMGDHKGKRDRKNIFSFLKHFLRDSRRARMELKQGPRSLAEALRDGGALEMPRGADRFTGLAGRGL